MKTITQSPTYIKDLNAQLDYMLAKEEPVRQKIYESRFKIFQESFPYLLNDVESHPAKDKYDDDSLLFCCFDKGDVVASCRVSPFTKNEWEISPCMPAEVPLRFDANSTIQLNRVYISEGYRNRSLHEFMFYHFSDFILKNTSYTKYFAVCNAGLVRLYKKLGAQVSEVGGFQLKHRGSHRYFLVTGDISDFNSIVKNRYSLTN